MIWASGVIHHLGDQQQALDALASLLAEDGRLALAEDVLDSRRHRVCCVVGWQDVPSRPVVRAGGQMALASSVNVMASCRPAGSSVAIS